MNKYIKHKKKKKKIERKKSYCFDFNHILFSIPSFFAHEIKNMGEMILNGGHLLFI